MEHCGKKISDAIQKLIELFAVNSPDRSSLDELYQMAGNRDSWHRAHDLFNRIRLKNLDATRRGDVKLEAQFNFEEACAKTLYNLTLKPGPFDPDSPYWIFPNALAAARHFKISENDIVKAIAG